MATYANRICSTCGIRKPQPQMYQKEVYVETGKSQTGISGATLVGVFLGEDKKSGTQFRNWLFNNGQRTYKRKKKVWLCGICSGNERPVKQVAETAPKRQEKQIDTVPVQVAKEVPEPAVSSAPKSKWNWWIIGFLVLMLAAAIDDCTGKSKKSQKQATTTSQSSP